MIYDVGIVGCGVVGAAIAFELSKYDLRVAIFEKENDVAMGATKANSAIIHAGYDPKPGSLMAKLNVRGVQLCKEICERLDVPYKNCGALVVAFSDDEVKTLKVLLERGEKNGVPGLRIVSGAELFDMEPELSRDAMAALYAPTSSIVSPWEYCLAMTETAVRNGADLFLDCDIASIEKDQDGFVVTASGEPFSIQGAAESAGGQASIQGAAGSAGEQASIQGLGESAGEQALIQGAARSGECAGFSQQCDSAALARQFRCKYIVNAAGVNSDVIHDMACEHELEIIPVRGQYYLMDRLEGGRAKHTIFQCPSAQGKGVLVSPTVHGNLIVGPDSETVIGEDKATTTDGLRFVKEAAYKSVPSIDFRNSIRNFAGVRARTAGGDFVIERNPNTPHFIDAAGMCSPGLSAAPAAAEYVAQLLEEDGLQLTKKDNFICSRSRTRFKELSIEEKQKLIAEKPEFGKIVCRCETITEGEILECFDTPIPPRSVDGVKRRVAAGMGRCQGGFCGPSVVELISKHYGVSKTSVVLERRNSFILAGKIGGKQQSDLAENIKQQSDLSENSKQQSDFSGNSKQQSDLAENIKQQSDLAGNSKQQSDLAENSKQQSDLFENSKQQSDLAGNSEQSVLAENSEQRVLAEKIGGESNV